LRLYSSFGVITTGIGMACGAGRSGARGDATGFAGAAGSVQVPGVCRVGAGDEFAWEGVATSGWAATAGAEPPTIHFEKLTIWSRSRRATKRKMTATFQSNPPATAERPVTSSLRHSLAFLPQMATRVYQKMVFSLL
jgi:hypothetical protein